MIRTTSKGEKTKLVSLSRQLRIRGWSPGAVAGWDNAEVSRVYSILLNSGLRQKTLPLACVVVELAAERSPDTVRGIMYAVVSAGWLPDTSNKSYARVRRILNTLRKRRIIPFGWITDNVRDTIKPSSWSGLADFAETVRDAYRMDFWARLPEYVAIIVEKDTVAGRIAQVTQEYDVPLHPLRGIRARHLPTRLPSRGIASTSQSRATTSATTILRDAISSGLLSPG